MSKEIIRAEVVSLNSNNPDVTVRLSVADAKALVKGQTIDVRRGNQHTRGEVTGIVQLRDGDATADITVSVTREKFRSLGFERTEPRADWIDLVVPD